METVVADSLVISGCNRSGTTLMLMLLAGTVVNHPVYTNDERIVPGSICKLPMAVIDQWLHKPILMIRDPREIVSSMLSLKSGYFVTEKAVVQAFDAMNQYPPEAHFRYSELVNEPDAMQRRIGEYWGLTFKERFSTYPHDNVDYVNNALIMNGIRPIDRGHDWREHRARVDQEMSPRMEQIIQQWGFA